MIQEVHFETVHLSVDFFISHPVFPKLASPPYSIAALILLSLYCFTLIIMNGIKKRETAIHGVSLCASLQALLLVIKLAPYGNIARGPNASTIVDEVADDRQMPDCGHGNQSR